MSVSAAALQLAGFLLAHGLWTVSEAPVGAVFVPQALCETEAGDRRLVSFDAATPEQSAAEASSFMGSTAGQFARCAFVREDTVHASTGRDAEALIVDLTDGGRQTSIVQTFRPATDPAGFRLLGDELLLDDRGVVLPREMAGPAIVAIREGAADHPGLETRWPQWNTGRDPASPLVPQLAPAIVTPQP